MAKKGFDIDFNTNDLDDGLNKLEKKVDDWMDSALEQMADSLLLLSRFEVPFDAIGRGGISGGSLQASGHVFRDGLEQSWNVAYNTPYASYQHEGMRKDGSHVVKNYSERGRKKKYLEDPLKMNLSKWQGIAERHIARKLNGKI